MQEKIIFRHVTGVLLGDTTSCNGYLPQVPIVNSELAIGGHDYIVKKLSYLIEKDLWSCVVWLE